MEDYIKCELIGGGFPRHLNTFSNSFIVAVLYTHTKYMLCIVAIVDYQVVHYKIIIPLWYC